ncbi:endoplasmic oxidoreductin [Amylocystis lapponica]|nr:endoplasmic oxidoreductin [Amylocystis lapponica]
MFPRHLYALLLGFLLDPLAHPRTSARVALSQSLLSDPVVRHEQVQNLLEHKPVKEPACKQFPTGPIETTLCDYETVESVNEELFEQVHALVQTPFFKYFRVDLYRECPFWEENGFCANRECGITTVDESEIPERWRAAALSKVEMPPEDQRPSEGDYVDLTANPERFTGYIGPSPPRMVINLQENCFGVSDVSLHSSGTAEFVNRGQSQGARECLEQRVYYKIISGLHASISTHICHDNMNQTTGEWSAVLHHRVASYPERLQYIYFDTVLLLRAVARLGHTSRHDAETLERLKRVITIAQASANLMRLRFSRRECQCEIVKEEFKEHFRNVTRIMDCVAVQTTGIATALKVLFELDEKALDPQVNSNLLQRSEVVALINTLHRLTESLYAVNNFRRMWAEADSHEEARLIEDATATSDFFVEALDRMTFWVRACKDGTLDCVRGLFDGLRDLLSAVTDTFKFSGKEQAPRSDL